MVEVREIMYQWLSGKSQHRISRSLGTSRVTIRKIMRFGQEHGLEVGSPESLLRLDEVSEAYGLKGSPVVRSGSSRQEDLRAHHSQLAVWLLEPHMTVSQMVRLLKEQGHWFSESTLRRYVRKHFPERSKLKNTVSLKSLPGHQAQVDFGYVGKMKDPKGGKERKAYAFIMTLSYSRYRFVRFVFRQDVWTWIDCHIRAFHFFGGVPSTILIDNLKSGIIKAHLYDPVVNRSYGELERHYGFVVDPTKVRHPQHKGKVERSVQIVREQVLAGRDFKDIEEANVYALKWCREEISQRVTRTTGKSPWFLFKEVEQAHLKRLPQEAYECPLWKEAKVHKDHHVVFEGSYYSLPTRYIGDQVWVRGTRRLVEIYHDDHWVKSHPRAPKKGMWQTDEKDYPLSAQHFLQKDGPWCIGEGHRQGPFVGQLIEEVVAPKTQLSQRKAQAILRLGETYGPERLNQACEYALSYGNLRYESLKKILEKDLAARERQAEEVWRLKPLLKKSASYLRGLKTRTLAWEVSS